RQQLQADRGGNAPALRQARLVEPVAPELEGEPAVTAEQAGEPARIVERLRLVVESSRLGSARQQQGETAARQRLDVGAMERVLALGRTPPAAGDQAAEVGPGLDVRRQK